MSSHTVEPYGAIFGTRAVLIIHYVLELTAKTDQDKYAIDFSSHIKIKCFVFILLFLHFGNRSFCGLYIG